MKSVIQDTCLLPPWALEKHYIKHRDRLLAHFIKINSKRFGFLSEESLETPALISRASCDDQAVIFESGIKNDPEIALGRTVCSEVAFG